MLFFAIFDKEIQDYIDDGYNDVSQEGIEYALRSACYKKLGVQSQKHRIYYVDSIASLCAEFDFAIESQAKMFP